MGELLLCNHSIAAMPYYIEAISLNIYSLEELCYVIEHHAFLMEESFFEEELLLWIEREVGASQLAEELRQALQNELGVTKLVECILNETGYLSYAEGLDVISQIRQMQHKSVFERRKMRADRYVENKKYISALLEYRRILLMEEECKQNPVMCGNIWHNQGVVFSRLFLFREAKECFEKAYQYHMNMESVYEAMAACCFVGEEEALMQLAKKYGIDKEEAVRMRENWTNRSDCEKIVEAEAKIDGIFEEKMNCMEDISLEDNIALMQLLLKWKAEYQKNCG